MMRTYSEEQLQSLGLSAASLPRHVAINMDGNGRWAKSRRLPRSAGHRAGTDRLRGIIRLSSDLGIEALTLYAFSTENWKRPEDEVGTLMGLLVEYFTNEIDELHENHVQIRIIGDTSRLPARAKNAVDRAMARTRENDGLKLSIALNYGSRAEILRAANEAAKAAASKGLGEIPQELFESFLYTSGLPEVDLVIRTSGEQRISNFLLYQISYAEFLFPKEYWPDFSDECYLNALRDFTGRARRYGGLGEEA
ncbi:MAG: isoprenyl transferase [Clostridiaceae bacterium]